MKAIGLDIGTTTICGVLLDTETGEQLARYTLANDAAIETSNSWEKLQDPEKIARRCLEILDLLVAGQENIAAIGVTGQMHGIVYLNGKGEPVSPLITWQDGRGNHKENNGKTYAQNTSERTGVRLATGFGAVTHYWYTVLQHFVPLQITSLCVWLGYLRQFCIVLWQPV